MVPAFINTRADFEALDPKQQEQFKIMLAGSIYHIQKDDRAKQWIAVQDTSTIERFDFTLADFPNAQPPALPAYVETEAASVG